MISSASTILIALASLAIFSQFGSRLSAKHSLVWIFVFGFLFVASLAPQLLEPLAQMAGFRLVSNFVLTGLIFFAFLEILQQTTQTVKAHRKIRDLICTSAARRFLEKRSTSSSNPTTLIVCPCFNEEEALPSTLKALEALRSSHPDIEFCVVNDGSQDSSGPMLRSRAPFNNAEHLSNAGVSGALVTGFLIARELGVSHVVQCDSDGQHPFEFIPELVRQARAQQADLLIGSRFVNASDADSPENKLASTTFARWLGGRMISFTLRLFGSRACIKDPTSGFRVYSERAYKKLISNMPEEYPEPESIALLSQAGLKIAETFVKMNARTTGTSSLAGFRSAQFMVKVSISLIALRLRRNPDHA
jgi:hypothetical protein